jgi:hypothetical protein
MRSVRPSKSSCASSGSPRNRCVDSDWAVGQVAQPELKIAQAIAARLRRSREDATHGRDAHAT